MYYTTFIGGIVMPAMPPMGFSPLHGQEQRRSPAKEWSVLVERVETIFQSAEHLNFPFAKILPNGDIALNFSIGVHVTNERPLCLVSHDRGKTWEEPQEPVPSHAMAVLSDGTVVSLHWWGGEQNEDGTFSGLLRWSEDGGSAWKKKTVPIKMPRGVGPYTHRSMIAMPDDSLRCTYYSHRPGESKYHSGLLISTNRGQNWEYFADIAYDPEAPSEGYCEPVMIRLANGDLLTMLRTGGPMFQTRSTDGGNTWSKPERVMDHGVSPDLCLMSNGILVCSYGRPNAGIMFSYDGTGRNWEDAQDLYRSMGSHYTTVLELEPGLLMYYYAQSGFVGNQGPGPLNEIRVAYLRLKRLVL
ncbi:exo-alpha-sialidase [Candidatus Poribacteria bacterium]|nr:exo-alpha-sialidase [Candidatus Poribacteria bacterium]